MVGLNDQISAALRCGSASAGWLRSTGEMAERLTLGSIDWRVVFCNELRRHTAGKRTISKVALLLNTARRRTRRALGR